MAIEKAIETGALVYVLPDRRPKGGAVQAVFRSRRGPSPAVRSLIDHLAA
jgi:DNA-binding transcriptional LysR family regulator